jgi:hypothetical protein
VDGDFNADSFRDTYVSFMQTPGSHNDTFVGSCHRLFFQNLANGIDPKECPSPDQHLANCTDSVTVAVPVILKYYRPEHAA